MFGYFTTLCMKGLRFSASTTRFQSTWFVCFIVQVSIFVCLFWFLENRHFSEQYVANVRVGIKARILFQWWSSTWQSFMRILLFLKSCRTLPDLICKVAVSQIVSLNCLVKWYNDLPGSVSPSIIPMTFWILRISLGVSTTRWIRLKNNNIEFKLWFYSWKKWRFFRTFKTSLHII